MLLNPALRTKKKGGLGRPPPPLLTRPVGLETDRSYERPTRPVGQAFNKAFSGVTSTLIRWGLAVSAFGSVIVRTPRS